jgi:probable addiction module antidote protein
MRCDSTTEFFKVVIPLSASSMWFTNNWGRSPGTPSLVVQALGAIAKARGMTRIAKETGLRRESLYKALSPEGNPELNTVLKVVKALGIRLHAETLMENKKVRDGSKSVKP